MLSKINRFSLCVFIKCAGLLGSDVNPLAQSSQNSLAILLENTEPLSLNRISHEKVTPGESVSEQNLPPAILYQNMF